MKKKLIVLFCLVLIIFVSINIALHKNNPDNSSILSGISNENESPKENSIIDSTKKPSTTDDATIHTSNVEIDTTLGSYTILVNKEYGLPQDYVPDDLVVPSIKYSFSYYDEKKKMRRVPATALEQLCAAAAEENLILNGVSGYRSYSRQKSIYTNNIKTQGLAHTEKYSAKPGYSEHQTGLAIDMSSASNGNALTAKFGTTAEGQWLAANCYKYGFIIRYPQGKESITGYSYEPWHIRYVGIELATYLTQNNLTLDEYYHYTPSTTFSPDTSSDEYDLEDVPKATATPKPKKTPKPTKAPTKAPTATITPEVTSTPKPTTSPTNKPVVTGKPSSTPNASLKPSTSTTPTHTPAVSTTPSSSATPDHTDHASDSSSKE